MTSYSIIKNVTLSYSNISNEIYPLINLIRTDWNSSNTRLITFTEGLTNIILGIFDNRTSIDDDLNGLIIKIYGKQTDLFIDRQSEINAMNILSNQGVFSQRILIQFNNGIIYEYTSGQVCSRDDVRKENILKLIAIKLAQFHNVSIEKTNDKPYIILILNKFIELLKKSSFDLSSIISDINILEEYILPKLIPNAKLGKDLVLCHNDLLIKNIIYNEKYQKVSFIDFEYTHMNYALYDIANHFVEYAGADDSDFNLYPNHDEQKKWLEIYFQTRGIHEQIINNDLCNLIDKFSALAFLMWGLWGLVQAEISQLDYDYITYSKIRLDYYKKLRPLLFE